MCFAKQVYSNMSKSQGNNKIMSHNIYIYIYTYIIYIDSIYDKHIYTHKTMEL